MVILKQITFILFFYVMGEGLSMGLQWIHPLLFIPGTILGMLLLLGFLVMKWLSLKQVESVGLFLANNMAFFFIPAAVSVIEYVEILEGAFFKIIILIILSTLISFFSIIVTIKGIIWLQLLLGKRVTHE